MKATLEFNLEPGHQDVYEFALANRAGRLQSAASEAQAYIREKLKYGEPSEEVRTVLEAVRDILFDAYTENDF